MTRPDARRASQGLLLDPSELLKPHRTRLAALRLEGGYGPDAFEQLIAALIQRIAEYVHCLPATRAENHCEEGGLLRLAIEAGCIAFRRADGKFLAGPAATDIENRERDRVWRYATLVGALLRPLGRCVTSIRAHSRREGLVWNALEEPLWSWLQRVDPAHLEFTWRAASDARPTRAAAVWIASRLLDRAALTYLQTGGDGLAEPLLNIVSGERERRLCEIVEHAYQAAIDQDLVQSRTDPDLAGSDLRAHHRVIEALRELVREKWTANAPGARLWFTRQGHFLLWKPAVNDLLVRLRTQGVTDEPHDSASLAAILISHGVLAGDPTRGGEGLHRLVPDLKGLPRQPLEVMRLANAELLGWRTDGLECIDAEVSELHDEAGAAQLPRQLELTASAPEMPTQVAPVENTTGLAPDTAALGGADPPHVDVEATLERAASTDEERSRPHAREASPRQSDAHEKLERLARFGAAGAALQRLGRQLLADPQSCPVAAHPDGLAIGFPGALELLGVSPKEFLAACQAQGLLVPEHAGARNVLRRRGPLEPHLPEQYVVLAPRVARLLSPSG